MKTHYKLVYISNLAGSIDHELSHIENEIKISEDPDTYGIFDQYEQLIGIGFTVCQTFLVSVHEGKNKKNYFGAGPFHSNGKSYALITNACANYWKHHDEWKKEELTPQAQSTADVISSLGVDAWSPYPLSEVFSMLLGENQQATFVNLLKCLNQWASDMNEKPIRAGSLIKEI